MSTVLIVEDRGDLAGILARLVKRAGHRSDHVQNGDEALGYLRALVPDLIVLDLMMPKVDGVQVLRSVRADPRTAHVPVIVYTAAAESTRKAAEQAGATTVLVKGSLDADDLLKHLRKFLQMDPAPPGPAPADPAAAERRRRTLRHNLLNGMNGLKLATRALAVDLQNPDEAKLWLDDIEKAAERCGEAVDEFEREQGPGAGDDAGPARP